MADHSEDRAVLNTASYLIQWLNNSYFSLKSPRHMPSLTVRFRYMSFWENVYVALWDPEWTQILVYLGPSPRDWRTMINWNLVPTILHKPWDMWSLWKAVGTTLSSNHWEKVLNSINILCTQDLRVQRIHPHVSHVKWHILQVFFHM